jgi:hypothetical protein
VTSNNIVLLETHVMYGDSCPVSCHVVILVRVSACVLLGRSNPTRGRAPKARGGEEDDATPAVPSTRRCMESHTRHLSTDSHESTAPLDSSTAPSSTHSPARR